MIIVFFLNLYIRTLVFFKKKCKNEKGQYIILRYFNVAGADIKSRSGSIYQDSLIKNITNTILRKDKVFNVYRSNYATNDGTAIRDYIHVMDLVNIHFYALKYLLKNKKNLVLNCGYGRGFTVNQILEIVKKNFTNYNVNLFRATLDVIITNNSSVI